jgi:hypothetical protein
LIKLCEAVVAFGFAVGQAGREVSEYFPGSVDLAQQSGLISENFKF